MGYPAKRVGIINMHKWRFCTVGMEMVLLTWPTQSLPHRQTLQLHFPPQNSRWRLLRENFYMENCGCLVANRSDSSFGLVSHTWTGHAQRSMTDESWWTDKNDNETDMEPKLVNDRCVGNEVSGWMDIWDVGISFISGRMMCDHFTFELSTWELANFTGLTKFTWHLHGFM